MRVYKYPLMTAEPGPLGVRVHGRSVNIVHFGHDPDGTLCFWAEVDPACPEEPRTVHILYTGDEVPPPSRARHVGTCGHNGLILHLYDCGWRR